MARPSTGWRRSATSNTGSDEWPAPPQRTEYRIGYELTVDGGVTVPRWRREVK